MPTRTSRLSRPEFATDASRNDRLVRAATAQLAERGAAACSARSIAAAADASASAINYNFGGIEQLFSAAFAFGTEQTAAWLAARRAEAEALPRTPAGALLALEYLTTAWVRETPALALLYQEGLAASAGRGPMAAWTALWRDAWLGIAAAFGLSPAQGRLLHVFFESEALYHLSQWSPALEAAALRETCSHLGAIWLGAGPALLTGAVALAQRAAGVQAVDALPASALRVARAAAEVVERRGLPGLTHRAVAAQAGVTTGAVTHHFRTVEDLVAGAIRGQVLALETNPAAGRAPTVAGVHTAEALFAAFAAYAVVDAPWGPGLLRRRLFLAALRRPELAGAGAVIRFAHGGTAREALQRLFNVPEATLSLNAGLLSRLLSGLWFACSAEPSPRIASGALLAEIEAGFRRSVEGAA